MKPDPKKNEKTSRALPANRRENLFVTLERENEIILLKREPNLQQLYLEVTSRCNLECITCVRRLWPEQELQNMGMGMGTDLINEIVKQCKDLPQLYKVHLGGFGEPLSHPNTVEIIKVLVVEGLRVSMSTNGTLLTPELSRELIKAGLEKIIVSIDSTEDELFRNIRTKGELSQVIENIKTLQMTKKRLNSYTPRLGLEFVIMRSNAHQVKNLPVIAKELGISSVLLTHLLAHSPEMYKEVLYEVPGKDRTVGIDVLGPPPWDEKSIKDIFPAQKIWPVHERDWILWATMSLPNMYWGSERKCSFVNGQSTVIRSDGMISPCYALLYPYSYYFDNRQKQVESYLLGDIKEKHLLDIWNSPEYLKFRYEVRNYNFPSCIDCRVKNDCEYTLANEDCWGNVPSCADCLWSQGIVRCP